MGEPPLNCQFNTVPNKLVCESNFLHELALTLGNCSFMLEYVLRGR